MIKLKIIISSICIIFSLLSSGAIHALTFHDACKEGFLCFKENGSSNYGKVWGTNLTWNFGHGNNWNDRADYYYNRHQMSACIYKLLRDRSTGMVIKRQGRWLIPRGVAIQKNYDAYDFASANNFISNKSTKMCNLYN